MLPTPSTSHVDYAQIYEPAEDSYLFLDTISSSTEVAFLSQRFPPSSPTPLVVEVGTGSGVILAFVVAQMQHIFGRMDILPLGIDVNIFACRAAVETVRRAAAGDPLTRERCFLDITQSDLTSSVRNGEVDVIIFNPPYVPTEERPGQLALLSSDLEGDGELSSSAAFERDSQLLSLSYAGGQDGMETIDRLLDQLPKVLADRGVAYVLLCMQNRPDEVAARIRQWPGEWSIEKAGESGKTAGWEKLCILRIWRATAK